MNDPEDSARTEGYLEGKQEGIREVVEWIKNNSEEWERPSTHKIVGVEIKYDNWQAKLKEWGIE